MPKIDIGSVPERKGSGYPAPFHEPCATRVRKPLGDAGGLSDFGVNLLLLPPGAWSSQRHWHSGEDEFVYVLEGEVVMVTDKGEETLRAGDWAAFPKNLADGHQLINRGTKPARVLEAGSRSHDDVCIYSDIDMKVDDTNGFTHKDGRPYPPREK
ncbi:MAG TPA: cupin domain-containing protein [Rhizomicrobium sp.]|nr:cupin domain-containing protein [Rhizomicrobium sp.]